MTCTQDCNQGRNCTCAKPDTTSAPSFLRRAADIMAEPRSLTGQYLSGAREIEVDAAPLDQLGADLLQPAQDAIREIYASADAWLVASRSEGFGAEVKRRIMLGTYALSSGYYDAYYAKAQRLRTLIARDFTQAYEKCDVLLTPTTPGPAFGIGENSDDKCK